MKPISFIRIGDKVKFIYKLSDLKEWIARGNEHGDCGPILTGYQGKFNIFKGYGTIEHPFTHRITMSMVHHPLFDGRRLSPEEMMADIQSAKDPLISHSMYFLDLSNPNTNDR